MKKLKETLQENLRRGWKKKKVLLELLLRELKMFSISERQEQLNRISVIQIVKNTWDLATCRKVRKTNFHSYSETAQLN